MDASGSYIGASSTISMGRLVAGIIQQREDETQSTGLGQQGVPTPSAISPNGESWEFPPGPDSLEAILLSPRTAEKLLNGYLQHISTRWPVLHSAQIREWHSRRDNLDDLVERTLLHLVYANAGRYLQTTGEADNFLPERHYFVALEYLEEILQVQDIRALQVLLLLGIYSLRAPHGPGAW
jgi:hypothetical protein